jgi:hypothetical protein
MSPDTKGSEPRVPPDTVALLIQLHVAEYQALTTRATSFITLMAGIWTLVLLYVAFAAQVPMSFPRPLFWWGSGVILQTMIIFWAQFLVEQYQIVRYLEAQLHPLVQSAVGDAMFWQYEPSLAKGRTKAPILWEYAAAFGVAVAMILVSFIRFPFSPWDYAGLVINVGLLCALSFKTSVAIKTRYHFFTA